MPQDRFMNIGIDHGTSKSAIAVMTPDGPEIVETAPGIAVMPSEIFMYNNGAVDIGFGAHDAILRHSGLRGQGVKRYKTRLHLDVTYDFPGANKKLTGAEVGGFVIGKLLEAYRRKYPEVDPRACVISVPAEFAPHAYNTTSDAARLAGLEQVVTVQEPVAAGKAFGFHNTVAKGRWVVIDLGAGTLDVTLLYKDGAGLRIPEKAHDGDPDLGGDKFDDLLFGHVVEQLSQSYQVDNLLRSPTDDNSRHRRALFVDCAEQCKIRLSDHSESSFSPLFQATDDNGLPMQILLPIRRETYEGLIKDYVTRVVSICQRLIAANGLVPSDLDGMILVGGPTKTPYIRSRLRHELDCGSSKASTR